MYLTGLGIWCDRRIGLAFDQILNLLCNLTLTDRADLHHLGINDLRLFLAKIWKNGLLKHRFHLTWRSWKKDGCLAFFLKDQSRCGAIVVIENDCSLRDHCLLVVVGCDLALRVVFLILLEVCFHQFPAVAVLHQFHSHDFSGNFLRQIILGRSKSTCEDHYIRTVQCRLNGLAHTCLIVSHNCLIIDRKPKLCTFFGKICAVGIHNISKKYFCSYRNQLCYHLISAS